MKRLIDSAALIGKLRTRKANAVGHTEAMDAYETAMNDAIDSEEITLNDLRDEVYEDAVAHGLWEDFDNFYAERVQNEVLSDDKRYDCATSVHRECDELVEAFDNDLQFAEELADVIIMCMSVAGKLGIDIDDAVRKKMAVNKGRPWKHGKE